MSTYQERVIAEQTDLAVKIEKLQKHLVAPACVRSEDMEEHLTSKMLLTEQLSHMRSYNAVLLGRINLFK